MNHRSTRRVSGRLWQFLPALSGWSPYAIWDCTLPLVELTPETEALAELLLKAHTMPKKAAADALHVAAAALAGVQYLLTLNCRHIANAHELPRIYQILLREGFGRLLICTPAEFLGGEFNDEQAADT